jgi:hypothetical protein
MNMRTVLTLAATAVFLAGCATRQMPVYLAQNALGGGGGRVGVAMTALPKVDTYFPGASCLLCLAAASIANSSLTTYTQTLPYEDLPKLKDRVADVVRRKGSDVTVIAEALDVNALPDYPAQGTNIARKDFTSLQKKYGVGKLLVIEIQTLGMWRTYSAYFPTSDPKAVLSGRGYIVNLTTNAYEWYTPVNVLRSADGNWDEPPKFPGLTNAYFQALEMGKDAYLTPFAN